MAHTAELVVINRVQTAWFTGAEGPSPGNHASGVGVLGVLLLHLQES